MGLFQKEKGKREKKNFSAKPSPFLADVALPSSIVLHIYTHTEIAVLASAGNC